MKVAHQFQLGDLVTETPHPKTGGLSELAISNLPKAVKALKQLDLDLLATVWEKRKLLLPLLHDIHETLRAGNRVFLCGCGATGRLSIALETLWREVNLNSSLEDHVVSFMAGGDCALIASIEKFEDYPEYGARQLRELGFGKDDLLISTTEGGETPFVIGATEEASRVSSRAPYFLYCNPDDLLCDLVERSKNVIDNPKICKINLETGPMALAGSTRMQASSILMLAVGLVLIYHDDKFDVIEQRLDKLVQFMTKSDFSFLADFIKAEAEIYERGEYIYYETDETLGISIITDTTERAPTFSLSPFENREDNGSSKNSWSYLLFPSSPDSYSAWTKLLRRTPRTFKWEGTNFRTDKARLEGFDFSQALVKKRDCYLDGKSHYFQIYKRPEGILFKLGDIEHMFEINLKSNLLEHIVLKFILNIHSTLVMGRVGRYKSNIMTWVKPSNNKLIDRTVRYAHLLLNEKSYSATYDELVHTCFEILEDPSTDGPVVMKIVEKIIEQKG